MQLIEYRSARPPPANRHHSRGLSAALMVILADRVSKWYVARAAFFSLFEVASFLDLRLRFNSGISFGPLGGATWIGRGFILALSLVLLCGLVGWLDRAQHPAMSAALGLMIGGGVSNVLDRIEIGAVADFIDIRLARWHWPTFNLADVALLAGLGPLLIGGRRCTSGART